MEIQECWAEHHAVRLHYLDNKMDADPTLAPLVYIPGIMGSAEDFRAEIPLFAPRRCIAVSLRGRGKSDAPEIGYTLADHRADIEAIVAHAQLERFCLMAHSVGVAYAISYASRHPQHLTGLILLDYPARYPAFSPQWAQRLLSRLPPERVRPHAVHGLQRESQELPLWSDLDRITCPTLIVHGGRSDALLTAADVEQYQCHLQHAQIQIFADAGHELWQPDYDRFIATIRTFLNEIW